MIKIDGNERTANFRIQNNNVIRLKLVQPFFFATNQFCESMIFPVLCRKLFDFFYLYFGFFSDIFKRFKFHCQNLEYKIFNRLLKPMAFERVNEMSLVEFHFPV